MKNIIRYASVLILFSGCVSYEKKITSKFQNDILIIGESIEKENNFSDLLDSSNVYSKDSCREEKEAPSNFLVCKKEVEVLLKQFEEMSPNIHEVEKNLWKVKDQYEISTISKEYKAVKNLFTLGKFKEANDSFKSSRKLKRSKQLRSMQGDIEEKLKSPDYIAEEAISILELFDYSKEDNAVRELSEAVNLKPEILKREDLKQRAAAIMNQLKKPLTCNLIINEPAGEVYANTGFEDPLSATLKCQNYINDIKYKLLLSADGPVRFNNSIDTSHEILFSKNGKYEFPVSALGMSKEQNKIKFEIITFQKNTIEILEKFGTKWNFVSSISPAEYIIQNLPASFTPEYAEYTSKYFHPGEVFTVKGRDMEAKISSRGQFTFGSNKGGVPMDTLFGHPNGVYAEGIWSSYVSVKINDQVYRFDDLTITEPKISPDGKESITTALLPDQSTEVFLKIRSSVDGSNETIRLTLGATNKSNHLQKIGFRVMLDTWAGSNDGVPFTIPGATGKEGYIYTKELKFNPASSTIWETYDIAHNGTIFIRNNLVGNGLNPPDEVAFVNWGRGFFSNWDIDVNSDYEITGDSAVAQWWKPRELSSGKKFEVTTEFANITRKSGVYFDLIDKDTGFGYLIVQRDSEEKNETDISYEIQVENGEAIFPTGTNNVKFSISPDVYFYRMIPLNIITTSNSGKLKVTENFKGRLTSYNFDIPANLTEERAIASPIWNSANKYPITFISKKGDLNLTGRIVSKVNGALVGEVKLNPSKSGERYIYMGEINLGNSFEGNVDVIVVEK